MTPQDACVLCCQPIRWVITLGGLRWKIDAAPDPAGTVLIVDVDGLTRARILTGPELPAQTTAHRLHECQRPARPGPLCATCRRPMPADLARALGWISHPGIGCNVEYLSEIARLATKRRAA